MEVDDLTGRLTTEENRALRLDLAPIPCGNTSHDFLSVLCDMALQQTKLSALSPLDILSSDKTIHKPNIQKQQRQQHKTIQTPLSYGT